MNLIGKIFTVLIFVMSLVFASFCVMVYGAHVNWRDRVMNPKSEASVEKPTGLRYQLEDAKADNDKLQNQLTKTQEEAEQVKESSRRELAALETTKRQLEEQVENQAAEVARLTVLVRGANSSLEAMGASLGNLRDEVKLLRETLASTETNRDDLFDQLVRKTDELHAKANEYKVLLEQSTRLTAALIVAKTVAIRAGLNPEAPVDIGIPPLVEGKVLAVRANLLIEISIGSDDGLAPEHELQVYRIAGAANTYLGKVRVTDVTADRAVCRILPEYRKGAIQVGDDVATWLSAGS